MLSFLPKPLRLIVTLILIAIGIWALTPYLYNNKVNEKLTDLSPSKTSPTITAPEESSKSSTTETILQGNFEGRAGHSGEGDIKILKIDNKYFLRLEDNFKITNGPDLFIHFGNNNSYDSNARIEKLKGNIGGQNYEIPQDLDPLKFKEVWIWCRAFSVPFAKAQLN